jgi:lipoyl(octanoyl) transferase
MVIQKFYFHPLEYEATLAEMIRTHSQVVQKKQPEQIWYLTHQSVYTKGVRGEFLQSPLPYPVSKTRRGGEWTFHDPGQLIIYFLMRLKDHFTSVHDFLQWVQKTGNQVLTALGFNPIVNPIQPGFWIQTETSSLKIGSLGFQVKRGVTLHGIALNARTNLKAFSPIQPCGLSQGLITDCFEQGIKTNPMKLAQLWHTTSSFF